MLDFLVFTEPETRLALECVIKNRIKWILCVNKWLSALVQVLKRFLLAQGWLKHEIRKKSSVVDPQRRARLYTAAKRYILR